MPLSADLNVIKILKCSLMPLLLALSACSDNLSTSTAKDVLQEQSHLFGAEFEQVSIPIGLVDSKQIEILNKNKMVSFLIANHLVKYWVGIAKDSPAPTPELAASYKIQNYNFVYPRDYYKTETDSVLNDFLVGNYERGGVTRTFAKVLKKPQMFSQTIPHLPVKEVAYQKKRFYLPVYISEFGEITRIKDVRELSQKCDAIVEYSIRNRLTLFGKALPSVRGNFNELEESEACFAKYKDGWRLIDLQSRPGSSSRKGESPLAEGVSVESALKRVEERIEEANTLKGRADNIGNHQNNTKDNSVISTPDSSDDKNQVAIDKKYIGTWVDDKKTFNFNLLCEITESTITFYRREIIDAKHGSKEKGFIAYIHSVDGNNINVRIKSKKGISNEVIKIAEDGAYLLVPNVITSYVYSGFISDPRFVYDYIDYKMDIPDTTSYESFSKIKTFPGKDIEGKWFTIYPNYDLVSSKILEISNKHIKLESSLLIKSINKPFKITDDNIKYFLEFVIVPSNSNHGALQVTDIQPEILKTTDEFGKEIIFVPFTGQSHIKPSNSNSHSNNKLNDNQIGIVRDLLLAYKYDLDTIGLVADNADYAVLAWAAYGGQDSLDLAKQRGFTAMKSIVDENFIIGDTVATLFTHENGKAVLAFRGTTNSGDWLTNIFGTLFNSPLFDAQVEGAEQIARDIVKEYPDIVFVGHSLGGRLAQIGRFVTGNKAVVFNSAPIGSTEFGEVLSAMINKPTGSLIGFRGPEDPLGVVDPTSGFRDVVVGNIYRAESLPNSNKVTDAYVQIVEQNDYFHGADVLSSAMQRVQDAREQGWLDSYLYYYK